MTDLLQYGPQNAAKLAAPDLEMAICPDAKVQRRNKREEHLQQSTLKNQIDAAIARGRPGANMIAAVPNGTAAGEKVGAAMVREGVRKGFPDLIIAYPARGYHGAFIEMKKEQGVPSDVSKEQREWLARLNDAGYKAVVCFGWREAWKFIIYYLGWEGAF